MTIVEPIWGKQVLIFLSGFAGNNEILRVIVPIFADFFVLTYPLFLAGLYIYGIVKKQDMYKNGSLTVFFSAVLAVVINIFIQMFLDKARPESVLTIK